MNIQNNTQKDTQKDTQNENQICTGIICVEKVPTSPEKLFFGDNGKFLRIDKCSHKVFKNLYEKGFADFWTHKVVDFSKDRSGWLELDEKAQRIFLLNNGYQSLMDSSISNGYDILQLFTSNTELAILYKYISQNESIHAMSYSYGLDQMFAGKAEEAINIIYEDKMIQQRMNSEKDYCDELMQCYIDIRNNNYNLDEVKKVLLKTIFAAYYLEHVKFPFSFATTWSINEGYNNGIQGFSQLLKLIAYDELTTHAPTNANVLKILMRDPKQGFIHLKEWFNDFAIGYIKEQQQYEFEWIEYLFKDGGINGLTEESSKYFIRYMIDKTLKDISMEPLHNEKKSELIDWYNNYYDINNQLNASQEMSNISYQKGNVLNNLHVKETLRKINNNVQDILNTFVKKEK